MKKIDFSSFCSIINTKLLIVFTNQTGAEEVVDDLKPYTTGYDKRNQRYYKG